MSEVERFVRFCESDFGASVMDREAAYLDRFFESDERILDIGAGIVSIEERFPSHDITGIDISREMIRTARARVDGAFLVDDTRVLPIDTDAIDTVCFVATLEFIPEIETVLDEALRVLRTDGTLVALVLNSQSDYVQLNLTRDGSYFQRMVHRDTAELTSIFERRIDGSREYFLGIENQTVFETDEPEKAAMLAFAGHPIA